MIDTTTLPTLLRPSFEPASAPPIQSIPPACKPSTLPKLSTPPQLGVSRYLGMGAWTIIFTVIVVFGGILVTRRTSSRLAPPAPAVSKPPSSQICRDCSPPAVAFTGGTYIHLTPLSLSFGSRQIGTRSAPKQIRLANSRTVEMILNSISITDTNGNDFAETNDCGNVVIAGSSCVITVTFVPSAKGERKGSLSITDISGSQQKARLSGTGT